jgi:hypothetical protein
MESKCEILDDSEVEELEKNIKQLNFRRFDAAELEKRFSPFDKTQKKEFPFLFQKKVKKITESKISLNDITESKISLNDITESKISLNEQKISLNEQKISLNDIISNKEDESLTPPYSPYVDHYDLNDKIVKEEDGKK